MDFWSTLILSFGLAMDAFAVAIVCGASFAESKSVRAFKVAAAFGFFQAIMPLLGWGLMKGFGTGLETTGHWVSFGLLSFIGAKMIRESFEHEDRSPEKNFFETGVLLGLAIATSIDAFAAGISYSVLKADILLPACIIGAVTFALSYLGAMMGHKAGHFLGGKATIAGGVILIGLGIKILAEYFFL